MKVGPDWACMLVTYGLISTPSVLFLLFIAAPHSLALTIIGIFTTILVLSFYSYTACSDPGVYLLLRIY